MVIVGRERTVREMKVKMMMESGESEIGEE
jgi:hypothetical protein